MVRTGVGNENRDRVLTISQCFEENPKKFGSTKAHHGGNEFWVEDEGGDGWILLVQSLYVQRKSTLIISVGDI